MIDMDNDSLPRVVPLFLVEAEKAIEGVVSSLVRVFPFLCFKPPWTDKLTLYYLLRAWNQLLQNELVQVNLQSYGLKLKQYFIILPLTLPMHRKDEMTPKRLKNIQFLIV